MGKELQTTAKPSLIREMAAKVHMDPEKFQEVIKKTCCPSGITNEQFGALMLTAYEYGLNPITKEVYAFSAKGGGIQPIVGIDGWLKIANRNEHFDGMEHEFIEDEKGAPISCTITIYRKDRAHPMTHTEYLAEAKRNTDPWNTMPHRMLLNRTTCQAIRRAFGIAGVMEPDEAEQWIEAERIEDSPPPPPPDGRHKSGAKKAKAEPVSDAVPADQEAEQRGFLSDEGEYDDEGNPVEQAAAASRYPD